MFPSEKRSLRRFLAIYTFSTLLLIAVGSAIFYRYALHRITDHQFEKLKGKTALVAGRLHDLHTSSEPRLLYPVQKGLQTALYDTRRHYLIGDMKPQKVHWHEEFWQDGPYLYYRRSLYPYYLGAATIVGRTKLDTAPIETLRLELAAGMVGALLFILLVARWLGRLFLSPVHETMNLLDRFIKDTTHELNTPIATILTNIELFKSFHPESRESEEMRRIELAARRLSHIYDDLAYLQLNHRRHRRPERLDLSRIANERVAYFKEWARRKGLKLEAEIEEGIWREMDPDDAYKLFDNLLSNAIKYTPKGGEISVICNDMKLEVADTGIGMEPQSLRRATERFFRADQSEGGFGLGLAIVEEIVEHYGFSLHIESQKERGTRVTINWKREG
ncbi:sensor histidine kinase [Hydrogenimonas sp.]